MADATAALLNIGDAYGERFRNVGAAEQLLRNRNNGAYLIRNGLTDIRVIDFFVLNPGTTAWTPPGGGTIYFYPGRIQTSDPARNQAFIMHETLHEDWGLDDGDILEQLYGPGARSRPSADITQWFLDNCVIGPGNS